MAEIVQIHLESMTEELEEMRRVELFSLEETRLILKKRREFEYKIHSVTKQLEDFLSYIEYEKKLLEHIHVLRDKYRISDRKSAIDFKIRRRIKCTYEMALKRFRSNFSLWLAFFRFCKDNDFVGPAARALQQMIKFFPQKPEVWQLAAKYHAERLEINKSLDILLKGLSIHKSNEMLYSEAIKLELSRVSEFEDTEKEPTHEQKAALDLCSKKLRKYIEAVLENVKNVKCYLKVLDILEPHKFTINVQDTLIDLLLNNYSEVSVWNFLAHRNLRGLHFTEGKTIFIDSSSDAFSLCMETFKVGIEKLSMPQKSQLWACYLDLLISKCECSNMASKEEYLQLLKENLEAASEKSCLSEKYYLTWLQFLTDDEAYNVLEKGTKMLPHSVELWNLRLKNSLLKNDSSAMDIFKSGVDILKDKSLPLWETYLDHSISAFDNSKVKAIFEEGLRQQREITKKLKPKYIEWLSLKEDIGEVRKTYKRLIRMWPHCMELHNAMLKIESLQKTPNYGEWENVHKHIVDQFGKDNISVWLEYIKFNVLHKQDANLSKNTLKIYNEAINILPESLVSDFISMYQLLWHEV